jgi:hypothetical protein
MPARTDIFQETLTHVLLDYEASREVENGRYQDLGRQIYQIYRAPLLVVARGSSSSNGNVEELVDTFLSMLLVEGFLRDGSIRDADRKYHQPAKTLVSGFLALKRGAQERKVPAPSFRAFLQTKFRGFVYEYARRKDLGGREVTISASSSEADALLESAMTAETEPEHRLPPSEAFASAEMQALIRAVYDRAYASLCTGWKNRGFIAEFSRRFPDAESVLNPKTQAYRAGCRGAAIGRQAFDAHFADSFQVEGCP